MGDTKENNGQAARKRILRRLTTIALLCAVVVFALVLTGFGQEEQEQQRHVTISNRLRDIAVEKSNARNLEKRDKPGILSMMGHPRAKDGVVEVNLDDPDELQPLLSAEVHLIDIQSDSEVMSEAPEDTYAGITAEFCTLDFALHKKDPSSVPMFRFLVQKSVGCSDGIHYKVDLKAFTKLARTHDVQGTGAAKVLNLTGVVFHESRCGSTLVANALAAMNPTENRVFSESAPPIAALKTICGDNYHYCSVHQAAQILSDTMYLMARSNDAREKRVYFKIQSIGSRNIEVFQNAYPRTPWIFVYRDPVQVMMSQLKMGAKYANCVRPRNQKNSIVSELVHRKDRTVKDLSDEEYCAAHLATITESAVEAMQREPHLGTPVNYAKLPEILYKDILPNKFGVELTQEEIDNIIKISAVYSKGTGSRKGEFKDDSEAKEQLASEEVREAASLFLDESYAILEQGGIN